ncbi:MAG: cbb3-type cytochrome oxidase assembly protein CcoS [Bacteroidetes bacterium]|nr:cbb3-type cytochrome oxidase assembly protein CcoS [Bacteroidota bacterium]MCB0842871.1 cbb3-type cytochrome oxidase assembly protein CcoS [Bacteroidota bacterium]
MSAIIILIFISLLVAGGFLMAFIWAVKDGQYEDDYSPSVRILFEETTLNPNRNDQESDAND